MKKRNLEPEKKLTGTLAHAWNLMSSNVGEGIITRENLAQSHNAFGRPVIVSTSPDLGFVQGLAATGLRCTASLTGKEFEQNIRKLAEISRQQIPFTVLVRYHAFSDLRNFQDTHSFLLVAETAQQAIDYPIIAQHVTEQTLIPGIVAVADEVWEQEGQLTMPPANLLAKWLGDPDGRIPAVTPAQEMVFGKQRRRIPNWYSLDIPVLSGGAKENREMSFEALAREEFVQSHLSEVLSKDFAAYSELTGREVEPFSVTGKKHDHIVITAGQSQNAQEAIASAKMKRLAHLQLNQVNPLPTEMKKLVAEAKGSLVLEQNTQPGYGMLYQHLLHAYHHFDCQWYNGLFGDTPSIEAIHQGIAHMQSQGGSRHLWLDVPTTQHDSLFPKHQVIIQAMRRDYPESDQHSIAGANHKEKEGHHHGPLPGVVRQFKDHGPAHSRVAHFNDHTTLLHEEPAEWVADPFKANPVMPPATAHLQDWASKRETLPVFNPANCTGCSDCTVYCPHGAIPATVLPLDKLLKAGMDQATKSGTPITVLVPMVKNLVKFAHKEIKAVDDPITSAKDFLPAAFAKLVDQMKLEEEKEQAANAEFEAVMNGIGDIPLAITDTFYHDRERIEPGSGEFFTLAVDLSACTGCGICAAVCTDDALTMEPQTPDLIQLLEQQSVQLDELPDTSGDTIHRMVEDENFSSLGALMLSRYFHGSISGGSATEEEAPAKSVLHAVTAVTESVMQPRFVKEMERIEQLQKDLDVNIQKKLSSGLPNAQYDALAKALREAHGERTPFEDVIRKWSSHEHLNLVDTQELERKIALSESLKELKWALGEGPTGTGRGRYGLILDEALKSLTTFPWNALVTPAMVNWEGSSANLAKGLIQGQIRHLLDNIRLLRRAELEAKDNYDPSVHNSEIAQLSYDQLTEDERATIAPILVVIKRESLHRQDPFALAELLDQPWPVKLVVLDHAIAPTDRAGAFIKNSNAFLLPAVALENAVVLKSSLATPDHFYKGVHTGLHTSRSALFWLFAPDAGQHKVSYEAWPKLNQLAWSTRAFMPWSYNPGRKGTQFSTKMELEQNPALEQPWYETELTYQEEDEEKALTYPMTWADWAFMIKAWEGEFKPYNPSQGAPLWIPDYLKLEAIERKGRVPVIARVDKNGQLNRYQVSLKVVEAVEACAQSWEWLRDVAGLKTEFPEKLEQQLTATLTAQFDEEKAKLEKEHKAEIASLEEEHLAKIKAQIKNKLMAMAATAKSSE